MAYKRMNKKATKADTDLITQLSEQTNISSDRINVIFAEFEILGIKLDQFSPNQICLILQKTNDFIAGGMAINSAVQTFIDSQKSNKSKSIGLSASANFENQADLIADQLSDDLARMIWGKIWEKTLTKLSTIPTDTQADINDFANSFKSQTTKAIPGNNDSIYLLTGSALS
jgi:hypothetical protein